MRVRASVRVRVRVHRGRDGGADGGESVCGHGVFLGVGPGGARGVVDDAARGVVVDAAEGVGVDAEQCVGVGVGRGLTVGVNVRVRGIQLRCAGEQGAGGTAQRIGEARSAREGDDARWSVEEEEGNERKPL
eukprot:6213178-Pleurochrysis_carterae.AAC.1